MFPISLLKTSPRNILHTTLHLKWNLFYKLYNGSVAILICQLYLKKINENENQHASFDMAWFLIIIVTSLFAFNITFTIIGLTASFSFWHVQFLICREFPENMEQDSALQHL